MPLLIKRMIVEELGFDERLFLSFTSKRTSNFLGLFRTDLKGISITIRINHSGVSVCLRKTSYRSFKRVSAINIRSFIGNEWKFRIPYDQDYMKGSSAWIIDGSAVQAGNYPSTIYCSLNDEPVGLDATRNAVIVFGKLLRHLNSILNIQECRQFEFIMTLPAGLLCELDCNYSYSRIETRAGYMANTTPEDLTFLLDNIKTDRLRLNVAVPSAPGYKYRKNPKKKHSIDVLRIINYSWVDFSELPAARVISMKIQSWEMNEVLKSWVAGRNWALEIGDFEVHRLTNLNREAIFNGITRFETQLTKSERDKFLESVYPSLQLFLDITAVDILRKSDGMRATVVEVANRNMFVMVWSSSCHSLQNGPVVFSDYSEQISKASQLQLTSTIRKYDSTVQPELYPSTIYCDLNDKRVGRYTTSNLVIVFGELLTHLNKFLKIEKCRQCEFNNVIPVGSIPQFDCTYSYEKIHIRKANPADVTPEDLTLLLEHIKTKQLCLNVKVSSVSDYKYQKNPEKKGSIDVVKIGNYSWVDFSDLPAARVISIMKELRLDQMNVMLRSWVAGRSRDMEIGYFEIGKLTDQNHKFIFTGIETHVTQLTGAEFRSIFDSNENLPSNGALPPYSCRGYYKGGRWDASHCD
ncbi:hypothetical protein B9Z55_003294 [Caenorhabditis nigoni]|nr:hypothetical protein B9Z55_003294 [Caenorhabditis nigoni]